MLINSDLTKDVLLAVITAMVICFAVTRESNGLRRKSARWTCPRMQGVFTNHPIPRMGGLGIFLGFIFSVLIFVDISVQSGVFCLGAF